MSDTKSRHYDYDYDHNVSGRHGATAQNGRATLLNVARLYFSDATAKSRLDLYISHAEQPRRRETIWLTRKNVAPEM